MLGTEPEHQKQKQIEHENKKLKPNKHMFKHHQTLPALHGKHEDRPLALWAWPMGQGVHMSVLSSVENVPGGHESHTTAPVPSAKPPCF